MVGDELAESPIWARSGKVGEEGIFGSKKRMSGGLPSSCKNQHKMVARSSDARGDPVCHGEAKI